MKTKIKIKAKTLSLLLSAIFIITPAAYIPVSSGLVDSNINGDYDFIPVSSLTGQSVSSPLYEETPPLSLAFNIIRGNFALKKTALLNSEITFNPEEFEKILGVKKINSITITKIPDFNEGVLVLGSSEILEGQTISRGNIQYIRLVPYPNRIGAIKFSFKNTDDKTKNSSVQCVVSVLDSLKFNPSAEPVSFTTQKGISVYKSMSGTDPDGCDISYKIIKAPKNGLLEITDMSSGLFVYRPDKNFTGNDSFIYQVEDEYGNKSNLATAQIKVTKAACDVKFSDMNEHWAANAAIKAVAAKFIDVDNSELKFEPDKLISRAEFVEMVIRAAKLDKNMSEVYTTVFADDSEILYKYKPYAAKAYELGIINSVPTATGLYFDPNNTITRAEAAVIVNNILKIPVNENDNGNIISQPVFADSVYIPEWAENDITALNSCGIINGDNQGNVNPNGLLDKAQSAEMLCAMIDYSENAKKTGGIFSFLFK